MSATSRSAVANICTKYFNKEADSPANQFRFDLFRSESIFKKRDQSLDPSTETLLIERQEKRHIKKKKPK